MRIPLLLSASLVAAPLSAQDDMSDAAFDEALKQFGYDGGVAYACADDASKPDRAEEIRTIYNGVAQLFGTDRAFFFAAAFGAGSVEDVDEAACAAHLEAFADGLEAHNQRRDR